VEEHWQGGELVMIPQVPTTVILAAGQWVQFDTLLPPVVDCVRANSRARDIWLAMTGAFPATATRGRDSGCPEGWVMVPRKPTPSMVTAAAAIDLGFLKIWNAMLEASSRVVPAAA